MTSDFNPHIHAWLEEHFSFQGDHSPEDMANLPSSPDELLERDPHWVYSYWHRERGTSESSFPWSFLEITKACMEDDPSRTVGRMANYGDLFDHFAGHPEALEDETAREALMEEINAAPDLWNPAYLLTRLEDRKETRSQARFLAAVLKHNPPLGISALVSEGLGHDVDEPFIREAREEIGPKAWRKAILSAALDPAGPELGSGDLDRWNDRPLAELVAEGLEEGQKQAYRLLLKLNRTRGSRAIEEVSTSMGPQAFRDALTAGLSELDSELRSELLLLAAQHKRPHRGDTDQVQARSR